jgi:hypothetical protein
VKEPICVPADMDDATQAEYVEKLKEALACGRPDFDFNEH